MMCPLLLIEFELIFIPYTWNKYPTKRINHVKPIVLLIGIPRKERSVLPIATIDPRALVLPITKIGLGVVMPQFNYPKLGKPKHRGYLCSQNMFP